MSAGLAALAAAVAAALLVRPRIRVRVPHRSTGWARGPVSTVAVAVLVGTGLLLVLHGTQLVLGGLVALAAYAAVGMVVRTRRAGLSDRRTDQVLLACESLRADLAAGQPPLAALNRVAGAWPEFAPVATAGRLGADVPAAMRRLAARPGADQLRVVAATWHVAHRSGTGLADALGRAVESIRADRATVLVVAGELASARATARLMAVLPVGVLVFGTSLGGDPFGFLLGTPAGVACLAVGGGLTYAGLRWLQAIADRVLRR
jgi:tight adherence protein B